MDQRLLLDIEKLTQIYSLQSYWYAKRLINSFVLYRLFLFQYVKTSNDTENQLCIDLVTSVKSHKKSIFVFSRSLFNIRKLVQVCFL